MRRMWHPNKKSVVKEFDLSRNGVNEAFGEVKVKVPEIDNHATGRKICQKILAKTPNSFNVNQ